MELSKTNHCTKKIENNFRYDHENGLQSLKGVKFLWVRYERKGW